MNGQTYVDFVRRITFNVSRICAITSSSLQLAEPLIALPSAGMSVQKVVAFVDREGSSFFQEWSGLFIVAPDSGGQLLLLLSASAAGGRRIRNASGICRSALQPPLHVSLHALPTTDANDNETVLCYRSYFPAPNAAV